jgi:hypothetical protein
MKTDLLPRIAERKIEMDAARDDQPGSGANRGVEVLPTEQSVLDSGQTTLSKIKYAGASLTSLHSRLR